MPMMGLPDCSFCSDRPKFMYRSRYNAVMSAFAGSSNQARDRNRNGLAEFDPVIVKPKIATRCGCYTPGRDPAAQSGSPGDAARPEIPEVPGIARRPGD